MFQRAIWIVFAFALLPALSGCGLLREWYAAVVADSVALRASHSLGDRRLRGIVVPANEGLGHLALRAETWVDFKHRMDARSQQVAIADSPAPPAGVARPGGMLLQIYDMHR